MSSVECSRRFLLASRCVVQVCAMLALVGAVMIAPLKACAEDGVPSAGQAFKGWELYSWQDGASDAWLFSLLPGTNRNKTLAEIQAASSVIPNVAQLEARMASLVAGESVYWFVTDFKPTLSYPDEATLARVLAFAAKYKVNLVVDKIRLLIMKRSLSALAILVAGCSQPAPYAQMVAGTLLQSGAPVAGVPVRFVLSPPDARQPCVPALAEMVTNADGRFSLLSQYAPQWTETLAVHVQRHVVCVRRDSTWEPVWDFKTGPALHEIVLRCAVGGDGKVACEG